MRKTTALISFLLLAGCTHHYVPSHTTFDIPETMFDRITGGGPVALNNIQEQTSDVLVIELRGHKWFGNMHDWSDTAIRYIETELGKKHIPVSADSPRTIGVAVTGSKCLDEFWTLHCMTTLEVRLGNDKRKIYTGDNKSPATLTRAIDGSIMRAVTSMFNDDTFIAYLQGTE